MRLAVLGMGAMGRALGERAESQGHDVVAWNRTKGKSGPLPEVDTTAEAIAEAAAVLVVVHDEAAVREVCTDRLLGGLRQDAQLLIVTTVAPAVVQGLESRLPGRTLDTPVLGTPTAVRDGSGHLFVGGSVSATAAVAPLLDDLGGYTRCGDVGSGAVMKILSNLQLVIGVSGLAEAVAAARSNGVDDDVINEVFGDSVVIAPATRLGLAAMLDPDHRGELGPVDDAATVVRLAQELGSGLSTVLTPGVQDLLGRVADGDWPDFSAVIEGIR